MKCLLTILAISSGFFIPAAFAQESTNPIFSSPLIAWTSMQTPQPPEGSPLPSRPVPEPQPDVRVPANPPDSSTDPSNPQASSEQAQPAARTFTGEVSTQGDTYVLNVSGSKSYKLDDQDQAKQYDGQRVRVLGLLDEGSAVIHIQNIEPLL